MGATWFTSDTHFFHERIISYCDRPWLNADEMNHALIDNWNSVVNRGDTVIHCGDVSFAPPDRTKALLDKLFGNIVLVAGNHDSARIRCLFPMVIVGQATIEVNRVKVDVVHMPSAVTSAIPRPLFHGHHHGHCPSVRYTDICMYDVGVDARDYYPVSLEQVLGQPFTIKMDHARFGPAKE